MSNSLFEAAFGNDPGAIEYAVKCGEDPNQVHSAGGYTPLQVAVQRDALKAIDALLASGANPGMAFDWHSRVDGRCIKGRTALMYAISSEAVRKLIDAGAEVNAQDENGWSALCTAVDGICVDVVDVLLQSGADPSLDFRFGNRRLELRGLIREKAEHLRAISSVSSSEALRRDLEGLSQIIERLECAMPRSPPSGA